MNIKIYEGRRIIVLIKIYIQFLVLFGVLSAKQNVMEMLKFNTCDDSFSNKQLHIFVRTMEASLYNLLVKKSSSVIYQTHLHIQNIWQINI